MQLESLSKQEVRMANRLTFMPNKIIKRTQPAVYEQSKSNIDVTLKRCQIQNQRAANKN